MNSPIDQFQTGISPTWCPGCGNFGILAALKASLVKLGIPNHETVIVYGVGCHGNMRDWMRVYGVGGLHGRALPLAQGVKLANSKLHVIAITGDGDCIGEGGNHFLHAAKRNPDITVIIHDNQVYSLTTGQASPTAEIGLATKSTPEGVLESPVNPLSLALVGGGTFVSRGFSGDIPYLTDIFSQAISHRGFSVVDVLQPCVTFDPVHSYEWYRKRVYKVERLTEKRQALECLSEWGDKIPVGVFYEEKRDTSEDREYVATPQLIDLPLEIPNREAFLGSFR